MVWAPRITAQDLNQSTTEKIFDKISYGTVTTNVIFDTIHSFKNENRKSALIKQGLRLGLCISSSELVKRLVHETRPDGSDNKSFWSEHSTISACSQGYNIRIGFSLTLGTMGGRVVARRHHEWDTIVGALVGTAFNHFINEDRK